MFGFTEKGFPRDLIDKLVSPDPVLELKQVHSSIIHDIQSAQTSPRGDGIILDQPGWTALIRTADCIPLFCWHRTLTLAALIHVGWRGFQRGIDIRLMEALQRRDADAGELFFFMGPSIEAACYPVGDDVRSALSSRPCAGRMFAPAEGGCWHLDLRRGLRCSLTSRGVPDAQISESSVCTFCHGDRFPSYRRDGARGERIFSFINLADHET